MASRFEGCRHHRRQQRHRACDRQRFVEEGAFVFITGQRKAELDQAKAAIGRNVSVAQDDIVDLADLDRLYDQVYSGLTSLSPAPAT